MAKPIVFISHIAKEKEIAIALKEIVERAFLGMMDVFVSSDPTSIQMGQQWLDRITHALKHCAVEIILASPTSVKREWINFEAGAAWVRDVPVIPLCHSGMVPSKLPSPLSTLQAATATEENELRNIFPVLAKAIGSAEPSVDFASFMEIVRNYEETSKQITAIEKQTGVSTDGLAPHELSTLVMLAGTADSPDDYVLVNDIKEELGMAGLSNVATNLAMAALSRKSLVETQIEESDPYTSFSRTRVTPEGWQWLEDNKENLILNIDPPRTSPPETSLDGDDIPF